MAKEPQLDIKFTDKRTKALRFINKRVENFLRNLSDYAVGRVQEHLIRLGKLDQGRTIRSVRRIRTSDGNFAVEIGGSGRIILHGRGPTVNQGPGIVRRDLVGWIRRKGIDVSWASGKTYAQRLKSAAAVFARKIHQKGFGPTNFITPTQDDIRRNWKKIARST